MSVAEICTLLGARHIMSSWSEPFDENGQKFQRRQCGLCNLVEYREVQVVSR